MTLSLDDVRNKRFRMARKSGYEVLEVDEFVDDVEVAFEQLSEENQNLKQQIEALQATPAAPATQDGVAPAAQAATPAGPETIVVTAGPEASSAVVRLVALSTEQAERLVDEATAEAAKIRDDATTTAQQLTGDAQARADRISAEAQAAADQVQADARTRADSLDAEIASRRAELLDDLHSERDELQIAVGQLRSFEATFRASLANELREHASAVEERRAEPHEVPSLAAPAAVAETTQRASTSSVTDTPTTESAGDSDDPTGDDSAAGKPTARGAAVAEASSADGASADATASSASVFPDEDPADSEDRGTSETPRLDALLGDQR